jgi:hypothetical protein
LTALLVVPILLLVAVGTIWSGRRDDGSAGTGGPAAIANAQVPDAAPFVTAAVRFVNVWGRLAPGQTPDQWHEAVRALSTPQLASALTQTSPESLPGISASGKPSVRYVTSTDAIIAVPMTNGRSVVVSVISPDAKTWLVRDVQPDAGN